ncbi:unnamed protein product [Mycena citricolor]|uniref:Uncharacterized protein n=1 Tax=Mycena citricolor TaxID=2018698 RepID=A0AAD2HY63_9AGAR|nr:unnamed protein product [Mycena citricolor]CAK5282765.1 unnamed protein product [Mycena citricolor]
MAGPGQERLDDARRNEDFHKQAAAHARQDRRFVNQENETLRRQLATFQNNFRASEEERHRLQQFILESQRKIAELERGEADLHGQIMDDQDQLQKLAGEAADARQVHDNDVRALHNQIHAREEEVEQLRQTIRRNARSKVSNSPTAKRRGRVSTELFNPGRPALIQLPLDPAPVPASAGPSRPTVDLAIADVAKSLDVDADVLSKLMGVMELVNNGRARVMIGSTNGGGKQSKRKAQEKAAVAPQTGDLVKKAHAMMRQVTYQRFGCEQATDFIFHTPATEEEVEAFANDDQACIRKWQFDFSEGYTSSAWNMAVLERLVAEAEKEDNDGMGYVRKGLIQREFLAYIAAEQLARYRGNWKQFQPKWDPSKDRMETRAEAIARGQVILFQRRMSSKTINAQHDKYNHCHNTVQSTITLKEEDGANNLATWKRMLDLLVLLGANGMSEEEETPATHMGSKIRTYKILLCWWREPVIADYMRMVDVQTAHFQTLQTGAKPAPRVRGQTYGSRAVPKGLPESLYNKDWLKSLSPKELKEVKVSKQVFTLFVAATERMGF